MKEVLLLKFKIGGNLRFLSHLETLSMFQRALVRAGVNVCYSEGFNPRPKVSLPLPRSVGCEGREELFYAKIEIDEDSDIREIGDRIAAQMPQGCEVLGVELAKKKKSFCAESALYVFPLEGAGNDDRLTARLDDIRRICRENEPIFMERSTKGKFRRINVSGYIESIECCNDTVAVKCNIRSDGTIRIDEILSLLGVDADRLSGAVSRESVRWKDN